VCSSAPKRPILSLPNLARRLSEVAPQFRTVR
jgi:hypothetical protein